MDFGKQWIFAVRPLVKPLACLAEVMDVHAVDLVSMLVLLAFHAHPIAADVGAIPFVARVADRRCVDLVVLGMRLGEVAIRDFLSRAGWWVAEEIDASLEGQRGCGEKRCQGYLGRRHRQGMRRRAGSA